MPETTKPADAAKTQPVSPVSKDDLKAFRALVTPKTIADYPAMSRKEVEAYQALGPILDELIDAQK